MLLRNPVFRGYLARQGKKLDLEGETEMPEEISGEHAHAADAAPAEH